MANSVKNRGTKPLLIATCTLILLFAALPTTTVLVVGMAPTITALIVDMTPGRYLAKCVAGMNFAGVFPFLNRLWVKGHDMATAIDIVTDVFIWLVMYSAAATGWMLFLAFPGAVAMFRALNAKRRIYVLSERQKELIDEWGDCVRPGGEQNPAGSSGPVSTDDLGSGATRPAGAGN